MHPSRLIIAQFCRLSRSDEIQSYGEVQGRQSRDKNQLMCTSIRTEPVSKSAISFLKMNDIDRVKCTYPGTLHSKSGLFALKFNRFPRATLVFKYKCGCSGGSIKL